MTDTLKLSLTLEKPECLRGESAPFEVMLENGAKDRLDDLPGLDDESCAVQLMVEGPEKTYIANGRSVDRRDGTYFHSESRPTIASLRPGEKWKMRGDVLSWIGEAPPGQYTITATYVAGAQEIRSNSCPLTIRAAKPVLLATARVAAQTPNAPLSMAWSHQGADGFDLYFQQQSPALPRNTRTAVRVARTPELLEAWPAVELSPDQIGHVVWLDRRGRLQYCAVAQSTLRAAPPADVKAPFAGRPLSSPASLPDGRLIVPLIDTKRQRVALVHLDARGGAHTQELHLNGHLPLGCYTCFWEYEDFLHFAWATPQGMEVAYLRVPISDPSATATPSVAFRSREPVLALEAYLDDDAPRRERQHLSYSLSPDDLEGVARFLGPQLVLWAVTHATGALVFTRVHIADQRCEPTLAIPCAARGPLRAHRTAVTRDNQMCAIIVDADERLYYASTARRTITPLSEIAGRELTLADQPGLITATRVAPRPWTYLTYLDRQTGVAKFVRLEPHDEVDPVERTQESPGWRVRRTVVI